MASELSRSQFAHDTLKESTAALETLSEQYSIVDTMLSSSKNLLGTLLRSNKSDTWYLETAFYILCATCVWLIWRRLLYGPTWWFFWFPMKMFIKGWTGVFTAVGILGGTPDDGGMSLANSATSSAVMHGNPVEHVQATRPAKAAGDMGQPPRNVRVGGGGRGAPVRGANVPGAVPNEGYVVEAEAESVSEQVGKIIDGSRGMDEGAELWAGDEGEVLEVVEEPNPKKRMWEDGKEEGRLRDEL